MTTPDNLKYTSSHEWVRQEADGTVSVGITSDTAEFAVEAIRRSGAGKVKVTKDGKETGTLSAKHIILAMGSVPRQLPFLKVDGKRVVNFDIRSEVMPTANATLHKAALKSQGMSNRAIAHRLGVSEKARAPALSAATPRWPRRCAATPTACGPRNTGGRWTARRNTW